MIKVDISEAKKYEVLIYFKHVKNIQIFQNSEKHSNKKCMAGLTKDRSYQTKCLSHHYVMFYLFLSRIILSEFNLEHRTFL